MAEQQNYKNHVQRPVGPIALTVLNLTLFVTAVVGLVRHYDLLHWFLLGLAVSAGSAAIAAREYALKNQNRLIRLEENVRLHHLGVNPEGLSMRQMIALRFANDAEVPALAKRAETERLDPKAIKQAVQQWRADHERV